MATNLSDLIANFEQETAGQEFQPYAYYDADSDALMFFISNEPEHGKRLNSRVTIYLSDETDELVGCRIKGVHSVLEDIGSFDVSISHRKIKLTMLFAALHGKFAEEPESRNMYRHIGRHVGKSDLEIDLPDQAVC